MGPFFRLSEISWTDGRALMPRDHFDGRKFFNPTGPALQGFTSLPRLLLTQRAPWPRSVPVTQREPPARNGSDLVVTFIGHATFLIQTPVETILTDPVFADCAGPFGVLGPRRVRRPGVAFDRLPRVSLILLSHNHYDHCDVNALRALAERFDPAVITPLGNARLLRSTGLRRIEELDWWDEARSARLPVTLTPAHHFSARTPFDRNRALWGGFLLTLGAQRVYFAGDTGYTTVFKEVYERSGPVDLALLPIGAYEPRWFMQPIHMNPAEAVQAHIDLRARASVAMHFGTFQLTPEGIDEPVRALAQARDSRQIAADAFRTLDVGESIMLRP
jgi:L-ascorbate metabolism protein UlaG (beta-lactamase superfamily)